MDWKKIGKALLFPHIAIMIILLPIATVFMVYAMIFMGTNSIVAIVSYMLAFYTLLVWSFKVPYLICFLKILKRKIYMQDDGSMNILTRKIMLGCTGGVISIFIIIMAGYMIVQSNKKLYELKQRCNYGE